MTRSERTDAPGCYAVCSPRKRAIHSSACRRYRIVLHGELGVLPGMDVRTDYSSRQK